MLIKEIAIYTQGVHEEYQFFQSKGYNILSGTKFGGYLIINDFDSERLRTDLDEFFTDPEYAEKRAAYIPAFAKPRMHRIGTITIGNYEDSSFTYETPAVKAARLEAEEKFSSITKNDINAVVDTYANLGKKFGLFKQTPDRVKTVNKLIETISENINSSKQSYEEIARAIYQAKVETHASHKKGSWFGRLGITSSRLETRLNKYLADMIRTNKITQEQLDQIKEEQIVKPTSYKRLE